MTISFAMTYRQNSFNIKHPVWLNVLNIRDEASAYDIENLIRLYRLQVPCKSILTMAGCPHPSVPRSIIRVLAWDCDADFGQQ